jgi:hypothetical protein
LFFVFLGAFVAFDSIAFHSADFFYICSLSIGTLPDIGTEPMACFYALGIFISIGMGIAMALLCFILRGDQYGPENFVEYKFDGAYWFSCLRTFVASIILIGLLLMGGGLFFIKYLGGLVFIPLPVLYLIQVLGIAKIFAQASSFSMVTISIILPYGLRKSFRSREMQ